MNSFVSLLLVVFFVAQAMMQTAPSTWIIEDAYCENKLNDSIELQPETSHATGKAKFKDLGCQLIVKLLNISLTQGTVSINTSISVTFNYMSEIKIFPKDEDWNMPTKKVDLSELEVSLGQPDPICGCTWINITFDDGHNSSIVKKLEIICPKSNNLLSMTPKKLSFKEIFVGQYVPEIEFTVKLEKEEPWMRIGHQEISLVAGIKCMKSNDEWTAIGSKARLNFNDAPLHQQNSLTGMILKDGMSLKLNHLKLDKYPSNCDNPVLVVALDPTNMINHDGVNEAGWAINVKLNRSNDDEKSVGYAQVYTAYEQPDTAWITYIKPEGHLEKEFSEPIIQLYKVNKNRNIMKMTAGGKYDKDAAMVMGIGQSPLKSGPRANPLLATLGKAIKVVNSQMKAAEESSIQIQLGQMVVESLDILADYTMKSDKKVQMLARCITDAQLMALKHVKNSIMSNGPSMMMMGEDMMKEREYNAEDAMDYASCHTDKGPIEKFKAYAPETCQDFVKMMLQMMAPGSEMRSDIVEKLHKTFSKVMGAMSNFEFDLPSKFLANVDAIGKEIRSEVMYCRKETFHKFISNISRAIDQAKGNNTNEVETLKLIKLLKSALIDDDKSRSLYINSLSEACKFLTTNRYPMGEKCDKYGFEPWIKEDGKIYAGTFTPLLDMTCYDPIFMYSCSDQCKAADRGHEKKKDKYEDDCPAKVADMKAIVSMLEKMEVNSEMVYSMKNMLLSEFDGRGLSMVKKLIEMLSPMSSTLYRH